eukprot:8125998-Pyramimonas_sp.AAC.1
METETETEVFRTVDTVSHFAVRSREVCMRSCALTVWKTFQDLRNIGQMPDARCRFGEQA